MAGISVLRISSHKLMPCISLFCFYNWNVKHSKEKVFLWEKINQHAGSMHWPLKWSAVRRHPSAGSLYGTSNRITDYRLLWSVTALRLPILCKPRVPSQTLLLWQVRVQTSRAHRNRRLGELDSRLVESDSSV